SPYWVCSGILKFSSFLFSSLLTIRPQADSLVFSRFLFLPYFYRFTFMRFDTIFTEKRVGSDKIPSGPRSGFQRDFDRLIFSSAFRRLQNKTQVFPLPGTAFVHN